MKNTAAIIGLATIIILASCQLGLADTDKPGCKDHPLFSRMEGFYIGSCDQRDFAAERFIDPETKKEVTVEGRYYEISYRLKKGYEKKYSWLQISRNYANAIKKIGGSAYENDPISPDTTSMKLLKDGKEIWAAFRQRYAGIAGKLCVIEKEAMKQEIVANAKFMAEGLQTSGHVALYGIYFDFNKADVKPESEPALREIARLLQDDTKLHLYVVGHTDNVGNYEYNVKLSQARAEAIVKTLVNKHKIAASRLKAGGVGPLAPVSSNDTEEGRAKNRRVELVKQ